jgi:ATP-dependent 26S proteasome regulatory subunit
MSRRLIGFDTHDVSWDKVVADAIGLSAADVIQASVDAARRAVLESSNDVSTNNLIDAIRRRKSLHALGVDIGRPNSPPLRS